MTVIILESVPIGVRGELSRWMLEIHAGVFVGRISAGVRDALWRHICGKIKEGAGFLVYQTNNEQGYGIRSTGDTKRRLVDFEGLTLVSIPVKQPK